MGVVELVRGDARDATVARTEPRAAMLRNLGAMDADGQPATSLASPRSPALLRIESLTVRDFRGLTACTLALEPALTLLVGRNGSGKSRLLRALALACGSAAADGDDFTVDADVLPTLDLVLAPPGGGSPPPSCSPA